MYEGVPAIKKPPVKQIAANDVGRRLDFLSPQRRKLVQPILDKPSEYVLLSLRQVARKLRADPSTVLRSIRALGFHQYAEFRAYLHERVVAFATSAEPIEYRPRGGGLADLIRSSVDCDIGNLKELLHSLEPPRVIAVAKKIWAARRVVVLAGDMTASLGTYCAYTLAMLGFNVFSASTPGEMVHRTRSLNSQDVAIAITYRRGLAYTVDGFQQASQKGAYCVGLSDSHLSPIAPLANEFFITPTDRVAFADSYCSCMALINVILVAVANQRRNVTTKLLEEAAVEQRTGRRFFKKQSQ